MTRNPSGPAAPTGRRSGPTILVALLALVVGAGLGLAALWWWMPGAEASDEADGPTSDAAHACAVADVLPHDRSPESTGPLDEDPTYSRLGALTMLAAAAGVGDETYSGLDEQAQLLARELQTWGLEDVTDELTALRAECDRLGFTGEE